MLNIIGLFIIIAGFAALYVTDGRLGGGPFFYIGSLLCLSRGKLIRPQWQWPKWAQIGILVNIALGLLEMGLMLIRESPRSISKLEYYSDVLLHWLVQPTDATINLLFPRTWTHLPDGVYVTWVSWELMTLTAFLDVVIPAAIAVAIGFIWENKNKKKWKSVCSMKN